MSKIPKIIHYCWFGRARKPETVNYNIATWKHLMPDYQIIEWTEDNFDIHINLYVRHAYEAKKFAFVSDYARLYALYHFGGIYLDTDVEVLKSFDDLLHHEVVFGFEVNQFVATSTILAKRNSILIKDFLESYQSRVFVNIDGSMDLTTNVKVLTNILESSGLIRTNNQQQITYKEKETVLVMEKVYFSPFDYNTKSCHSDSNTYAIHHFSSSWSTPIFRLQVRLKKIMVAVTGLLNRRKIFAFY